MSEKIVGFTLGTPLNPSVIKEEINKAGYATETWVKEGYQPKGNYLESSALPTAINTALAQAKASGEFDGKDGKTPVKGEDYWTAADKAEMVSAVVASLPKYNGEVASV